MNTNIILGFDEGSFRSSCVDGFKLKIERSNITLDEIKLLRLKLDENDYYIENFNLIGDDILEVKGGLVNMPPVESLEELVTGTKTEENNLIKILHYMEFYNFDVTLYVSGLYY